MASEMLEQLAQLEERTARAEALASALEEQVIGLERERASMMLTTSKPSSAATVEQPHSRGGTERPSRSIQELLDMLAKLRIQLIAGECETGEGVNQSKRMDQLARENEKLKYRMMHLVRAVKGE